MAVIQNIGLGAAPDDGNGDPIRTGGQKINDNFSNVNTELGQKVSSTLANGNILVGNVSNVAAGVAMSGEASISNAGAVTLSNGAVIAKTLTGYTAGAGTVSSADSLLTAIQKIDGNVSQESIWNDDGTDVTTQNAGRNVDLGTGALKDNDVTTAISLGDASNTSLTTTNKTIVGSSNELNTNKVNLAGTAGGQTVNGGTLAAESLTLSSTANATKGKIVMDASFLEMGFDRSLKLGTPSGLTPYAWYHLNEGAGITAGDSSGSARPGVLTGGISWDTSTPKLGAAAISSANNNEYIVMSGLPSSDFDFSFDQAFSIEGWFRVDAVSGATRTLFGKGTPGDGYNAAIAANGLLEVSLNSSNSARKISKRTTFDFEAVTGIWHYIAFTYDGSRLVSGLNIYIDGSLAAFDNTTDNLQITDVLTVTEDFQICGINLTQQTAKDISFDEVVVYDSEISGAFISTRYNGGAGTEDIGGTSCITSLINDSANQRLEVNFGANDDQYHFSCTGEFKAPNILVGTGALQLKTGLKDDDVTVAIPLGSATDTALVGYTKTSIIGALNEVKASSESGRVVTAAGAVTVVTADNIIVINKTVGEATAVNLPPAPNTWDTVTIKDGKGDAATNNITITPNAGNIDGSATFVIGINYGSAKLTYNGTEWNVI